MTLEKRRSVICENMAVKSSESELFQDWYNKNNCERNTRTPKTAFKTVPCKNEFLKKSPIVNFTNILNRRT